MSRKTIIFLVCVAIMSILPLWSSNSYAKPYKFIWENFSTSKHRTSIIGKKFGNAVTKASKGQIKFTYHFGEPVPKKELLDATGRGTIDVMNSVMTYYSGKIGIADFTLMPSNFRSWEDMYDLFVNKGLWEILDRVYREKANCTIIYPFCIFSSEDFQISRKARKVRHVGDFKGMRLRAAGGSASMAVKLLGASPVTLIGGEYYMGMRRGTVDGGLMPMYSLETYKMWEVCSEVVNPPLIPKGTIFALMNLDDWNKLSNDLKETIRRIGRDHSLFLESVKYVDSNDKRIREKAKKQYGVEFYTLPKKDAHKMYKKVEPVWDWYVKHCEKQGLGKEAREIRKVILSRFYGK